MMKILVYTHGKSEFRLVMAHHHMGKAYLKYRCYEQSIDHLTMALKKNSKLAEIKETKLYHAHILTTLSKCYFEIASYDDALEVLMRALDIEEASYAELHKEERGNLATLSLIANCHSKTKNTKRAVEFIEKAEEYAIKMHGERSK